MIGDVNINKILLREKKRVHQHEDKLLEEARRLLIAQQFSEKHILQNLKSYNQSFELVNEEETANELIFQTEEIKNSCIKYRLKFLDSQLYPGEIPYEAILKIQELNAKQHKDLKQFKILASSGDFKSLIKPNDTLLFAKTVYGNYCLIHQWGSNFKRTRKIKSFPLRNFESLFITIALLSLVMTLSMPTTWLTTDRLAEYFSLYRAAAFFHMLILNIGFTVYLFIAFRGDFSSSSWDTIKKMR